MRGVQQPILDLERTRSGAVGSTSRANRPRRARPGSPSWNSGGDGPAWSRKRQPFEAPDDLEPVGGRPAGRATVPYAELHCHSNFSFLDGASHPEELATEAARLGLEALAITDHNGFYGVVRFAEAAKAVGLPTVFGTEITLIGSAVRMITIGGGDTIAQVATGRVPDSHAPDPHGTHLLAIADGPDGYARLRGRSAWAISPARRGRRSSPSTIWRRRSPVTPGCSPAAARVRCRRR